MSSYLDVEAPAVDDVRHTLGVTVRTGADGKEVDGGDIDGEEHSGEGHAGDHYCLPSLLVLQAHNHEARGKKMSL